MFDHPDDIWLCFATSYCFAILSLIPTIITQYFATVYFTKKTTAAELHSMSTRDKECRFLEGGWLYLLGEPNVFWSLMIHRRLTSMNTCLPPCKPGLTWAKSWIVAEVERTAKAITGVENPCEEVPKVKPPPGKKVHVS